MKSRWVVVALYSLAGISSIAVGQTPRTIRATAAAEPPSMPLHAFTNASQPEVIARVLAFQPAKPLGPVDVLKGYEAAMTMIADKLTADLISISQASRANQITRDQAEYLIQDRYQVSMMQHDVLVALHESLERDIAQAAQHGSVSQSDTAIDVEPRSGPALTQ